MVAKGEIIKTTYSGKVLLCMKFMDVSDIFLITGNSMAPLLQKSRDAVVIEKVDFSNLKKNDIILFKVTENPVSDIVCHRIYKVKPSVEKVLEKGDHHFKVSEVKKAEYIGKVILILKNGVPYDLNEPRNRMINRILGILVHIYHLKTLLYLFFHKETTIDMMCKDKCFRDRYFYSYKIIANYFIQFMVSKK